MRSFVTRVGLILSALATGLIAVPAHAGAPYIVGPGDLTTANCAGATVPGAPGVGGVCPAVPPGAKFAAVTLRDKRDQPIAGQYYFRDAANVNIEGSQGVLCGDRTVPVPTGAVKMTVYVTTAYSALDCGLTAAAGTAGEIGVEFSTSAPPTVPTVGTTGSGSPNVTPVAHLDYPLRGGWPWPGGTDLEFVTLPYQGGPHRFAVAGSYQNGLHIIDVTNPAAPVEVATYDCKMFQADIQILSRPDGRTFVAYSVDDYSNTNVESSCFVDAGYVAGDVRYGTFFVDITDPATPHAVSFVPFAQGSHNTSLHPSGQWLYSSNADLGYVGTGTLEVFDIRDIAHPTVASVLDLGPSLPAHDVTFSSDGTRGYVAALSSSVILDTTNPGAPSIIGRVVDPAINIHHQADPVTLTDPLLGTRTFLLITDEIAGAEGNGICPGGGIHVYDITGRLEATPVKVGYFALPDQRTVTHRLRCTAHVMRIYPDQKKMTIAWYNSGVRVLDLSGLVGVSVGTPGTGSAGLGMRQIGWYAFDKTDTWAVKAPADGFEPDGSFYMYASDQLRGFDVYRFDASAASSTALGTWLTPRQAAAQAATRPPRAGVFALSCVVRPDAATVRPLATALR